MTDQRDIQHQHFTRSGISPQLIWLMVGTIAMLLGSLSTPAQANEATGEASLTAHVAEKTARSAGFPLTDPETAETTPPGVVRPPANAIRPRVSVPAMQVPRSQPISGQAFSVQPLQIPSTRSTTSQAANSSKPSEADSTEPAPTSTLRIGNQLVVLPQAEPRVIQPEAPTGGPPRTRRTTQTFVVPGTGPGLPTTNPQANGQTPSNLVSSQTETSPDGRSRRTTQTFVVPGTGPSDNAENTAAANSNAGDRANSGTTVATGPRTGANSTLVPGIPDSPDSTGNTGANGELSEADRLLELGMDQLIEGDFEAAFRTFNQVLLLNPNDTNAAYLRGLARYQMGDKQGTIADYRRLADRHRRMGNQEAYDQLNQQILLIQQQVQQEAQQQGTQQQQTPQRRIP